MGRTKLRSRSNSSSSPKTLIVVVTPLENPCRAGCVFGRNRESCVEQKCVDVLRGSRLHSRPELGTNWTAPYFVQVASLKMGKRGRGGKGRKEDGGSGKNKRRAQVTMERGSHTGPGSGSIRTGKCARVEPPGSGSADVVVRHKMHGVQTQGEKYWNSMAKKYDQEIYDSFNEGAYAYTVGSLCHSRMLTRGNQLSIRRKSSKFLTLWRILSTIVLILGAELASICQHFQRGSKVFSDLTFPNLLLTTRGTP